MTEKYYLSSVSKCDICGSPFDDGFMHDARIGDGPWGNICSDCFEYHGCRLGVGFGQKYQKDETGRFKLIEGGS